LPKLLRETRPPFQIEFHDEKRNGFQHNTPDDEWLSAVSSAGWVFASHDRRFHHDSLAVEAIRQHNGRVFYFPHASSPLWYKLQIFVRSYEKIRNIVRKEPPPWVYNVAVNGRVARLKGI